MPHPVIEKWLHDPQFTALSIDDQQRAIDGFYNDQVRRNINDWMQTPDFVQLPDPDRQQTVKKMQSAYAGEKNQVIAALRSLSQPSAADEQRGVLAEVGSSLASGALAVEESITSLVEMGVNKVAPGTKFAQAVGAARGQLTDARANDPFLKRPEYLAQDTVLEHPQRLVDWRWWVRSLGENLPNMAAMMLPGIGAMQGAKALGAGVQAVKWAGRLGAFSGAAAVEAGYAYSQAKDEMEAAGTYSDDEIESVATAEALAIGTANGLLEMLPFESLFLKKHGSGILKRIVRQGIIEGSTETAQEAVSLLVEKLGHKPDQKLRDNIGRMLESALIGGVMGGGAGAIVPDVGVNDASAKDTSAEKTSAASTPMTDTGRGPVRAADAAAGIGENQNQEAARKQVIKKNAESILKSVLAEQQSEINEQQVPSGSPPGGRRVAPMRTVPSGIPEKEIEAAASPPQSSGSQPLAVEAAASGPIAPMAQSTQGPPLVAPDAGGSRVAPQRTIPSGVQTLVGSRPVPIEKGQTNPKLAPPVVQQPPNPPATPSPAVQALTGVKNSKRANSMADYTSFIAGLSQAQREHVKDLIVDNPQSPGLQTIQIKKALADIPAQAGSTEDVTKEPVKLEDISKTADETSENNEARSAGLEVDITGDRPVVKGTVKASQAPTFDYDVDHIDEYSDEGAKAKALFQKDASAHLTRLGKALAGKSLDPKKKTGVSSNVAGIADAGDVYGRWELSDGTGVKAHLSGSAMANSPFTPVTKSGIALVVNINDGPNHWLDAKMSIKDLTEKINALAGRESSSVYGSKNKLVTNDRAEELRAKLRSKLNQVSAGIDPELIALGTELAVYHIEAGARSFVDYAKAMVNDLGDKVKPYLRSFYEGARYFPGIEDIAIEMSTNDQIGDVDLENLGSADQPTDTANKALTADTTGIINKDNQEVENEATNAGAAPSPEPGNDSDRGTEPRPALGATPVVADRQSTTMDMGNVQGESAGAISETAQDRADRNVETGDSQPRRKAGARSDFRSSQPAGVSERRPGVVEQPSPFADRQPAGSDSGLESESELAPSDRNHVIGPDDVIVPSGDESKIKSNISAIKLFKKLQAENRNPNELEKKTLAKYVGWGKFAQKIFTRDYDAYLKQLRDDKTARPERFFFGDKLEKYKAWEKRYGKHLHPSLFGDLTQEQWDSARASTLNAHYTSREVIDAMWQLVYRMGFKSGAITEPAAGVGHFIGLMPASIASRSQVNAVELDEITGAILEKLYPQSHVQITGFESARGIPDNSQDLVISNFPFGKYAVHDPQHPLYKGWSIHNYFFGRSIDAVKPGGIVVAITSHYTLDAADGRVRGALAKKADFIGAIRLPYTAFKKSAGTEVVTDIIVFRKKDGSSHGLGQDFRTAQSLELGAGTAFVNEYFVKNPSMVLGKHALTGTMYGSEQYNVEPAGDFQEQLTAAINTFPEGVFGAGSFDQTQRPVRYAEVHEREGVLIERDGEIFTVKNGLLSSPTSLDSKGKPVDVMADKSKARRVRGYLKVKSATLTLIERMQAEASTDSEIKTLQGELTKQYDSFIKTNGEFGKPANGFLRQIDIEFAVVDSLERESVDIVQTVVKSGPNKGEPTTAKVKSFSKSDIFNKRTIFPFKEPESAENIQDAFSISRIYRNRIDTQFIADLLDTDTDQAHAELISSALVFEDPATGLLEPNDIYLSGNVRRKLDIAKASAKDNPAYQRNMAALEAVQPPPLDIEFIYFKLGTPWIPPDAVQDFMSEVLGVSAVVRFNRTGETSHWTIDVGNGKNDAKNTKTWGTNRRPGHKLVADCLNLKRSQVYDVFRENGSTRTVKNAEETEAAQEKQADLQAEFLRWGRSHASWGKQLSERFNEVANAHVLRKFEAPNIGHFPNANPDINLRELQKRFVARGLAESTLFAHGVGTGKTYSFITLAQEMRRVGTAKKPAIVVQNSTVGQYRSAFNTLYPAARVLIPDDAQRSARYRKRLLAQMATGDWDAIVLPHSFFDGIADNPDREAGFVNEQIDLIEEAISEIEAEEGSTSFTVKDLEALKKRKEEHLKRLLDRRKDNALTFEQLGIDALLIDEAHAYKRSEFFTKMGAVKGIDQGSSQRSTSLMLKAEYVREKTGGKNVILATGTPISNTTAELWTMLRYVRPELLEDYNVTLFDDFAATFGDTTISLEETESGTYKDVERFNRYVNGPELLTMFHTATDVQLTQTAGLNLPQIKAGKPESVIIPRSEDLTDFISDLRDARERWEHMTGKEKRRNRHIPLLLFGMAKKAAVDLRMIDPNQYPDDPGSKLNQVVEKVYSIWQDTQSTRDTQVVFLDIYRDRTGSFNAYDDMRSKLISKGVPSNEIIVIGDATNDSAREALFDRVRTGVSRIIMGSTSKLGIGVNVQDRLIAAHHVDAPPRPMDIEQRNGRIVREGNRHGEVQIFNYGVKGTLDSVMYDRLTKKQKFIDQMLTGDIEGRSFDDPLSEEQLSLAEQNAAFSNNPLVFEKADAEATVKKLRRAKSRHEREVSIARRTVEHLTEELPRVQQSYETAQAVSKIIDSLIPEGKLESFEIDGQQLDRKDFRAEIEKRWNAYQERISPIYKNIGRKEFNDRGEGVTDTETLHFTATGFDVSLTIVPDVEFPDRKLKSMGVFKGVSAGAVITHGNSSVLKRFIETAGGMLVSIENGLAGVKKRPERIAADIERLSSELDENKSISATSFSKADDLDAAIKRLDDVEAALRALPREQTGDDETTGSKSVLNKMLGLVSEDTEIEDSGSGSDVQYDLEAREATSYEISLADVQAVFKGQAVGVSVSNPDVFWVRMKNGLGVEIQKVEGIDVAQAAVFIAYGQMDTKGKFAAGMYRSGTITLNRHLSDRWTLAHESEHWLEDTGLLSQHDITALQTHIRKQTAAGKWETKNIDDIGGFEDRAAWVASMLKNRFKVSGSVGRVLKKIGDIIDALINLVSRTARGVVRDIESGAVYAADPDASHLGFDMPAYAMAVSPAPGPAVTRDMEADRTFANYLHEMADQARQQINVSTAKLQERLQQMAGPASRRRINLGIGYRAKTKDSAASRRLDQAMFFYRDLGGDVDKMAQFRSEAQRRIDSNEVKGLHRQYLMSVIKALEVAENLSDDQKAFIDEMGDRFEAGFELAQKHGAIQSHVDNYVRRIYKRRDSEAGEAVYSGWSGSTHGFKVSHGAAMKRTYNTAIDAIADGFELGITGLTNAYDSYMKELSTVLANRAFIQRGSNTVDASGRKLFTTNTNRSPGYEDYKELRAEGFAAWQLTGTITAEDRFKLGNVLETNSWGKDVFITQPESVPEAWAVYKSPDAGRASKVFYANPLYNAKEAAQQWAAEHEYTRIEHRPQNEIANQFQKLKLYAPAPLADMLNKMTASEPLFSQTPVLQAVQRFNAGLKSWILMSSFFHHLAGARSWVYGVHHGWGAGKHMVVSKDGDKIIGEYRSLDDAKAAAGANDAVVVERTKAAPWRAYKSGLDKVYDLHPLIAMGVKNGLVLGELQDWAEAPLREQAGIAERIAAHFNWDKASSVIERGKLMRERWANSLFKKYFAGLKAEAFAVEYVHELSKAQEKYQAGSGQAPNADKIAEKVSRLINADFGGLHLKRMGRNPTLQLVARLLLLAPDWTESNFRTVTGMVPGLNEKVNQLIGDVPPPAGMDKIYRAFWGRVALRVVVATALAQLLLNGKDDSEEFIKEQMFSNRFNKFRWTEVDVTRLYRMLGIDTEGQKKTFSLGGHFFDPLKLIDPWRLIKGKASPITRALGAGFSGSDWADRPFTGAGELIATGRTVKKSVHEPKEGGFNRLPATVVNQAVNMQPIQVGHFMRYLQGEEDGLTALLQSIGMHVGTAWKPMETKPLIVDDKFSAVEKELKRLQRSGLFTMGPPSKILTIGGISTRMSAAQYDDYLRRSSDIAQRRLNQLIAGPGYSAWSDAHRAAKVRSIIENARQRSRKSIRRELKQAA